MNTGHKICVTSAMKNMPLVMTAPKGRNFQVFVLVVEESEQLVQGEDDLEVTEEEDVPTVSLNAIHGESPHPMMRMTGWVGQRRICVLVDTGSTHNFVN